MPPFNQMVNQRTEDDTMPVPQSPGAWPEDNKPRRHVLAALPAKPIGQLSQNERSTPSLAPPDTDTRSSAHQSTKGKGKEREHSPEHAHQSIEGAHTYAARQDTEPVGVTAVDFARLQRMVMKIAERLDGPSRHTIEPRVGTTTAPDPRFGTTAPGPTRPTPTVADRHTLTPANSALGGDCYIPQGLAARPVFTPYGNPPQPRAANPEYDRRVRMNFPEPPKFTGKPEEFDNWIRHISYKLSQDAEGFKREDSRMMYVMTRLAEEAESSRWQGVASQEDANAANATTIDRVQEGNEEAKRLIGTQPVKQHAMDEGRRRLEELKAGVIEEQIEQYRREKINKSDPMAGLLGTEELAQ